MTYESQKKYFKTEKGKDALRRARQKYEASEKGKEKLEIKN
jgi:DNA-binding PadR family transcriptional regulator